MKVIVKRNFDLELIPESDSDTAVLAKLGGQWGRFAYLYEGPCECEDEDCSCSCEFCKRDGSLQVFMNGTKKEVKPVFTEGRLER